MATQLDKPVSEFRDCLDQASDVDALMRIAVEQLIARFHADAAILLTIPDSFEATCWAGTAAALPNLLIPGLPAKIDESDLMGRALKFGQPQVAQEPGLITKEQTVIAVPMKSGEQTLGLLRLSSGWLNGSDATTLATLTMLAGVLADTLRRLQALPSPSKLQSTPVESGIPPASRDADAYTEVQTICDKVYRAATGLMVCDVFFVVLATRVKTGEFIYHVRNGIDLPPAPVPSGDELIAYVMRHRSAVMVSDADREMRFKIPREHSLLDVNSLLGVPLIFSGQVLGVLSVQSYRKKSYSDADMKALTAFADLTAMALHYARR